MTNLPAGDQRRQARPFLAIAVLIVTVEATAYVVLAVWGLTDISAGGVPTAIGIAVFLAAFGLAQVFACWKLWRWQSWARGPLVFTQLILLGLAWGLRNSDEPWIAIVMVVCAIATLACLLAPPVTRALLDEDGV